MSRPTIEITRTEEFSASHRLHNPAFSDERNREVFGICNNPNGHGHNYELEVTVRGEVPADTGMVMNLTDLMRILRESVVAKLDHKHLNHDVDFLADQIPTAENIAIAIWSQLAPEIAHHGARLQRVRLLESRANRVDYYGPSSLSSPAQEEVCHE
ncbi:MAG: 6-carboxytetrahydropterin synthase [Planctomycetota bacterium]